MKRFSWSIALIVSAAFLIGSARFSTAADDKPASGGAAKSEKSAKPKSMRLPKPWKDISSLTEEQKTQLAEIRRKTAEEVKEVRKREHDSCLAVLNDAQKAELTSLEEKMAAEKKENKRTAKQTDVEKKVPQN
jgi:Spy/CpxP family protein refolding chaperone